MERELRVFSADKQPILVRYALSWEITDEARFRNAAGDTAGPYRLHEAAQDALREHAGRLYSSRIGELAGIPVDGRPLQQVQEFATLLGMRITAWQVVAARAPDPQR